MASKLTVVLVSLLVASPAVIFWFWLVFQQTRAVTLCPEGCVCSYMGLDVDCSHSSLKSIPSSLPTHAHELLIDDNNITYFENDSFASRGVVELRVLYAENCNFT
jgi:hypothetical protein